jgi:hypothetical protein
MPTAAKAAKARAKKQALLEQEQESNKNNSNLTAEKAAILADKNSRTIVKLSQLLEIYNKPGASDVDEKRLVAQRIERYKHRITRRLTKLAKVR